MVHDSQTLNLIQCSWKDEVVRMWRFSKSNGTTEDFRQA